VFAITDRDRWPSLIQAARAQEPPTPYAILAAATGYSRTHLWRLAAGRAR